MVSNPSFLMYVVLPSCKDEGSLCSHFFWGRNFLFYFRRSLFCHHDKLVKFSIFIFTFLMGLSVFLSLSHAELLVHFL